MNERKITDLWFPTRGLDLQTAFGVQRPQTTPCCKNCLGHEPCSGRRRGGRRPGLGRLDGRVILGTSTTIQHLNEIVMGDYGGLFPPDYPWSQTTPLLGAPGPSWTWGGGNLIPGGNWNGEPITGEDEETQDPLAGTPNAKKKRKKGSGIQPNPNQLQYTPGFGSDYRLFQCTGSVTITQPGPFFGTTPSFTGCVCVDVVFLRLAGAPTHMRDFNNWWCKKNHYFTVNSIAQTAFTFLTTNIIGNTSGDESTWGVRACDPTEDGVGSALSPCGEGYDPRNNVSALGFAECCGLMSVALALLGGTGNTASQAEQPGGGQSFYSCREAGQ